MFYSRDRAGSTLRGRFARNPLLDALETRSMMSSTTLPDIVVISATTVDSKSVTIDYQIDNAPVTQSIPIQVTRSADSQPHDGDPVVANVAIAASGQLDDNGQLATAVGSHQITLAIPGGLPPTPALPNVVVQANVGNTITESNTANDSASFHKYSIAIVTHGGLQPKNWKGSGPPWELHLAALLREQGFDEVIPYNWVAASGTAGSAVRQGPRLAAMVAQDINALGSTDPVDVQFIGHSEGAVVNSQAILSLNQSGWPATAKAGFLKVTMLDPHSANNGVKGQQYSVSNNFLGWIARNYINDYQSRAKDPPVVVPANVDSAEVYYQHTPVSETYGSNDGIYNLWGQVPVHGEATYYNLTAPGISHNGKFSVQDWYSLNVAPTIGTGSPSVASQALTATQEGAPISAFAVDRPRIDPSIGPKKLTYEGTAAPGVTVRLFMGRVGPNAFTGDLRNVGITKADAQGNWQITTRTIAEGHYRGVIQADPMLDSVRRRSPLKPTTWIPRIDI